MFYYIPNYKAFYLNTRRDNNGYKQACTKDLTDEFYVYIKFINAINIYDLMGSALSKPFLLSNKFSNNAVAYSIM